jgi:hypothetical protein
VKFLDKYAVWYSCVHLNKADFRDIYNMIKTINVYIIRITHSIFAYQTYNDIYIYKCIYIYIYIGMNMILPLSSTGVLRYSTHFNSISGCPSVVFAPMTLVCSWRGAPVG